MSRRSATADTDNLELLLDTMCNAFGGVMFIAMLLAVLSTVPPKPTTTVTDVKQIEATLEKLEIELTALRNKKQWKEQRLKAKEGLLPLCATRDKLENDIERLKRTLVGLNTEKKNSREKMKNITGQIDKLKEHIPQLNANIAAARTEIKEEVKSKERPLKLRVRKKSEKKSVQFMIKKDRLILAVGVGRGNSSDWNQPGVTVVVKRNAAGDITQLNIQPKQGKGHMLGNDAWKNAPDIRNILQQAHPGKFMVQFAIYPDSFGSFREVRKFFLAKGYSYNWTPMPSDNSKLILVGGGGVTLD